jgi:hypothetical protein
MQRPIHIVRLAHPAAFKAGSGMAPSCAVEPGAGLRLAASGNGAASADPWPGTPGIPAQFGSTFGQDRQDRYRQRGRTVARP